MLLAFGRHSGPKGGSDKKFFKKNVTPFILQETEEGRKVALIYELLNYKWLGEFPRNDYDARELLAETGHARKKRAAKIQSKLAKIERRMQEDWTLYRDYKGMPFMNLTLDWGFEDAVLNINRKKPGTVQHFLEPQRVDGFYNTVENDVLFNKFSRDMQLPSLTDYIRSLIKMQVERDKAVYRKAEELRLQDPSRSIVIPRGTAHVGMKYLFSADAYGITVKDAGYSRDFADDLLIRSYLKEPSYEELLRTAEMQMEYMKILTGLRGIARRIWLTLIQDSEYAAIKVEAETKDYVERKFA